jgi:hypothetical protein
MAMLLSAPAVAQTPPAAAHQEVVVVVTVPIPAGFTRERVVAGMQATVPQYQRLPGLIRKYFTLSDDKLFGGVYLFRTRAEAQAWFSDAWRAKSLTTYGVAPTVTYYNAPILLDGPSAR